LLGRIDLKGEALNLDHTFGCGQIFQWRKEEEGWLGAVGGQAVLLRVEDDALFFRSERSLRDELERFLSLDLRYDEIIRGSDLDAFSLSLLRDYRGLRILRQDPWACLVTYMVSASLSIRAIDRVLGRISAGMPALRLDEHVVNDFPGPNEFLSVRRPKKGYLGRKWEYLRTAAAEATNGRLDFDRLRLASYDDAWRSLVLSKEGHLLGVGPKVADCMLLFSLEKREAFPMDRWVMRGLSHHYGWLLPEEVAVRIRKGKEALSRGEYAGISGRARSYFGELGGLVQECLFLHMRTAGSRPPSV